MSSKDRYWEFCALYYGDAISSLVSTIWNNEKQRSLFFSYVLTVIPFHCVFVLGNRHFVLSARFFLTRSWLVNVSEVSSSSLVINHCKNTEQNKPKRAKPNFSLPWIFPIPDIMVLSPWLEHIWLGSGIPSTPDTVMHYRQGSIARAHVVSTGVHRMKVRFQVTYPTPYISFMWQSFTLLLQNEWEVLTWGRSCELGGSVPV